MKKTNSKPRLIVLSDLWGRPQATWWKAYQAHLTEHWDWVFYDCTELAQLVLEPYEEAALHRQFVNGGIKRAVEELKRLEKGQNPATVLAFSIGGTIAWQAIRAGWSAVFLLAISATRLRYETEALGIPGHLIYGSEDAYRPDNQWLKQSQLPFQIIASTGHHLYRDPNWIPTLIAPLQPLLD